MGSRTSTPGTRSRSSPISLRSVNSPIHGNRGRVWAIVRKEGDVARGLSQRPSGSSRPPGNVISYRTRSEAKPPSFRHVGFVWFLSDEPGRWVFLNPSRGDCGVSWEDRRRFPTNAPERRNLVVCARAGDEPSLEPHRERPGRSSEGITSWIGAGIMRRTMLACMFHFREFSCLTDVSCIVAPGSFRGPFGSLDNRRGPWIA